VARPESVGGTPAARMIHAESQQLLLGPHLITRIAHRAAGPSRLPLRLAQRRSGPLGAADSRPSLQGNRLVFAAVRSYRHEQPEIPQTPRALDTFVAMGSLINSEPQMCRSR